MFTGLCLKVQCHNYVYIKVYYFRSIACITRQLSRLVLIVMYFLQVVLLSATMPADVLEVTKKFMRDPIRILVKKEELTLEGIKQFYINVEREVGWVHLPVHNIFSKLTNFV